jgi:phospholipid/cholesterol/gamma-HCH transport system substrate-binding protein
MAILRRRHRTARDTGISPFAIGLIALALVAAGTYWAFTKVNPFADTYELNAIFRSANNLQQRSPVRIAGVQVGKVTEVEPLEDGSGLAKVTMKIEKDGLPIHEDANLKVRSRLFLEGNYFVDLHPGTPSAPIAESGYTVPPTQTQFPVQFGQVLAALQSDTREDLQTFFKEYSDSLRGTGARGFNLAIKHWEDAYRNTAIVNEATLGTERHDLSRLLRGQGRVFGALSRDERALRELVTDLNDTISGFAREEDNLRRAIPELRDVLREGRPALASLNTALPEIRAFARDALPGARSSLPTLNAQIPFTRQLRELVARDELQGLAIELRGAVPQLVRLNQRAPRTLEQNRALAACQNNVLVDFANTPIPDPDFPHHTGESFREESGRAFVALSGESRISDANTPFFRVQVGGGPVTIAQTGEAGERLYAQVPFPIEGVRPARPTSAPVFRPNVPCETQEPPDMNATRAAGDERVYPSDAAPDAEEAARMRRERLAMADLRHHLDRVSKGLPSIDPLQFSMTGRRIQARRLGLRIDERGRVLGVANAAAGEGARR